MDYPIKAFVLKSGGGITIGNANIVRELFIDGEKLTTGFIVNRRTESEVKFTPERSSEEFTVSLIKGFSKKLIRSSELSINRAEISDGEIKKAIFEFKPVKAAGTEITFKLIYEVRENDLVIRKYLDISALDADKVRIDYIDLEYLALGVDVRMRWSRPDMDKAYISKFQSALGQPVYINGMYLGCEFPATDNNIVEDMAHIRYYAGKTLADLSDGKRSYTSWCSILGAARSFDKEVVRADFLEYIKSISQPLYLRTQYNSWFDHFLDIDDDKINHSFFEIEKGLTESGVPPVHSYVLDDGWVDYDSDFWSFNKKFPNELYECSSLAKKFSSDFGLWLGPRGGYNSKTPKFARSIEKSGKGGFNRMSRDICVADHTYTKNVLDFFLDFMQRFDINYWKLDGFLLKPCRNKHHGHPTGGNEGMYCFSDCWESWIKIFSNMRSARTAVGKDLWINQTSYCNASPWHLQWSESLWMQNCADVDYTDKTVSGEKLCGKDFDRMLTYRDARYFDFCKTREYQFPLSNIYNHEPIYGNKANISMTDDEFRKYMYMIATRGTAFWELYYSYNMFTPEKWLINADVLKFIKDNFGILRNSKLIGNSPDTGAVYGYSAWDSDKGIVSVRNPANREQKFSFVLDRLIGVGENSEKLTRVTVLPYTESPDSEIYSYGDEINLTLAPHEIVIFKFGKPEKDAPTLLCSKFVDNNTIEFRFNKRIVVNANSFTFNGKALKAELMADYSDVRVTVSEEFNNCDAVAIDADISDVYGNKFCEKTETVFYKDGIIPTSEGISGRGDFAFKFTLDSAPKDGMILTDGSDLAISAANGKLVFDLMGIKAKSETAIDGKDNVKVVALRERNGMIKLYIDGKLDCSGFDAAKACGNIQKSEIKIAACVKEYTILNKAPAFNEIEE